MKYTVSIEIALPRERAAQLLADPAHLPKWLRGLVLHEPLSGVHFEREIVGEGMWSFVCDRLTEAGPETTLWVCESEYRFSGLLMRLVGLLMPGAFHKQSQQHMQDFKAFVEQGKDVREEKG